MTDHVNAALKQFLGDAEAKTLILRGLWGVGKTRLWNDFAKAHVTTDKPATTAICYTYASLFGKSSVREIERSILAGIQPLGDGDSLRRSTVDAASGLVRRLQKAAERFRKVPAVGTVTHRAKEQFSEIVIPGLGKIGDWFNAFDFVNNFLIVLDDLERRSSGLDLKEVLGLIDGLAIQRSCKVILICNEDALSDDDKGVLNLYRDKIFDLEVSLVRSPAEIAGIGLTRDAAFHAAAAEVLDVLGVSNIRVVKKLQRLLDICAEHLDDRNPRVIGEIGVHAGLLVWGRFDPGCQIPIDEMRSSVTIESWIRHAAAEAKSRDTKATEDKEPWRVAWDSAVLKLRFSPSDYDEVFLAYLERGTFDAERFRTILADRVENAKAIEAKDRLNDAWDEYAHKLDPNADAFIEKMKAVLSSDDLIRLSGGELNGALNLLEVLGEDTREFARRYFEAVPQKVAALTDSLRIFKDSEQSTALAPYLKRITEERDAKIPSLAEAVEKTGGGEGWNDEDIRAIHLCTEDDLIAWINSGPPGLAKKIKAGLLFEHLSSDDERIPAIRKKTQAVLRRYAGQSELNAMRVRLIYGINPDPPGHQ